MALNDGNVVYGSKVLSINSVNYVADNITVARPTKVIERTDELDAPNGQVIIDTFVTGSAQLQLATSSTAIPTNGLNFVLNVTGSNETMIISEVGNALAKDGETKVNISFRKKVS